MELSTSADIASTVSTVSSWSTVCVVVVIAVGTGVAYLQVLEVQVGGVFVGGLVSTMTVGDDGVQQILEDLVGLLVTGNAANGHDEGVT